MKENELDFIANRAKYISTDLVCESGSTSPENYRHAKYARKSKGSLVVERLIVDDEAASAECGRGVGCYITVSGEGLKEEMDDSETGAVLSEELLFLCRRTTKIDACGMRVLVACLGNRFITPDALGSKCGDKIVATRHIKEALPTESLAGCADVSVVTPGVLGQTGIESQEYVKGIADRIKPSLIVAIDAMAARSTSRLATTIQLSDAGLSPGKGVGKGRPRFDASTMGCPVIGIGSPTVVSSSTLIVDALEESGITDISPSLQKILDDGKSFFVTLNDSDNVIEHLSDVISNAVNLTFGTSYLA